MIISWPDRPLFLLILVLVLLPFLVFRPAALYRFSSFIFIPKNFVSRVTAPLYRALAALVILFFSLALSGITVEMPEVDEIREAAQICFVRDRSGSMDGYFDIDPNDGGSRSRIRVATALLQEVAASRPQDHYCLIDFGDSALTRSLLTEGDVIRGILHPDIAGLGGTEIAKPLERAISVLYREQSATSKVILIVSDGEAPIAQRKRQEMVRWMRESGIILMWILIGSGLEGKDLYDIVSRLGAQGMAFRADNVADLERAKEKIKSLPRGFIRYPSGRTRHPLDRMFYLAAYISLGLLGVFFLGELSIKPGRKGGAS